ncbi:hypothetical protein FQN50_003024 [Emmonsiellopsis sp. PD_5]|nr:hypothetical protein FQN50_003024 [Emmonsiellopsis sp. PD_5]
MTSSPSDFDDASQLQPLEPWDQGPLYAPTPGYHNPPSILSASPDRVLDERYTPLQESQPSQLGFHQVPEWANRGTSNEQPPTSICYLIEWRVTLNNRIVAKDTEQNLVLAPSAYWPELKQKAENVLLRKVARNRQPRSDDTTVVVSVNDRSQRDLTKRFENTDVDWIAIEKQLLMWSNLFCSGKKLRLYISINYIEDTNPSSRKTDKRGTSSVTKRMLAEQDAQADAEQTSGQPSVWRDVYRIMRCPGPPCHHEGQYCWQDPVGKKHYRLKTYHMKSLVEYVERGGIIETHDDIPDAIRKEIYDEEKQLLKRKQKGHNTVTGSSCPPININVLPTPSSQSLMTSTPSSTEATLPRTTDSDSIDIPGFLDEAVEEYARWQLSRVSSEVFKQHVRKACDVALENCLDLQQIYEDNDPDFFVNHGVKTGVARRFVRDVSRWVKQRKQNQDSTECLD